MAKTLELHFTNGLGKTSKLTIDNPKEPVNKTAVKQVMDLVIAADIFGGENQSLVSVKEARLVEHNVTDYEIV
ncbi:DUF2922 domain-containing protein [Niallia endozanthoxylica]|uniref:DUF2922 domain-containing protein n=2 Tax=Niallia endozanthoxylica TaxID=2036016 RepID=A0A5J5GWG5_9BACI|nr:DUF2922 domain-containing protein [Niallia endozanthoxylica]